MLDKASTDHSKMFKTLGISRTNFNMYIPYILSDFDKLMKELLSDETTDNQIIL